MKKSFFLSIILFSLLGLLVSCDQMNQTDNNSVTTNNESTTNDTTITYTVSFESNGGSSVSSMTIKKGDVVEEMPTPQKDGAAFVGWYFDDKFTEKIHLPYSPAEDIKLYAKWAAQPANVTFSGTTSVTRVERSARFSGISNKYSYTGHCTLTIQKSNAEYFSHYEIVGSNSSGYSLNEQTKSTTYEFTKSMGNSSSETIYITVYVVDTFGQKSTGITKSFEFKYQ